jgi:hypothetical protein
MKGDESVPRCYTRDLTFYAFHIIARKTNSTPNATDEAHALS